MDKYIKQREILFISYDLKQVEKNKNKYCKIIKFYKNKLVELGVMRKLPNKCRTTKNYKKQKVVV